MLAKEAVAPFDDADWIYEIKWDGFRAISELKNGAVQLYSRNGNDFANAYPAVVQALQAYRVSAVLDGEIIVLNEEGFPDFQKLQFYGEDKSYPIQYQVFDLLELNGHSLLDLPLTERKKLLEHLITADPIIKYSGHVAESGKAFFRAALDKDLEGIMAKRAESLYRPGQRTTDWLKIKNHKTTEVFIAGYTKPDGSRQYFGALVLGIRKNGKLQHAGQAGTGYNANTLETLFGQMQPFVRESSPFEKRIPGSAGITWLEPKLIAEVKFTEWTKDEKLRHPVYLRLRDDKSSKDIDMAINKPVTKKSQIIDSDKGEKNSVADGTIKIGNASVELTNTSKLYWPDEKISKGRLIEYYQEIADYILPFLKDRPQSLKRNPNGIKDNGFFHKDAGEEAPSFVKSFPVHSDSSNKTIDYIICNNKATLAYMNNLGCIEINPWHSTIKKPDFPDYMIIDIDPSEKNTFEQVIETANAFKEIIDAIGITGYCKTSGASGLHIYLPLGKKYNYNQTKDFAMLLCMIVSEQLPAFTTIERNLKKRGNKRTYLDALQNRRSQTISSVYSVRPKKGATVSMPLLWKEVKKGLRPEDFTINNAVARIKKQPDIFKEVLGAGINLQQALQKIQSLYGEYLPRS